MQDTATKLREITIQGETYYEVQWPKHPKGRNRQAFRRKTEAETFLKQKLVEQKNYGDEGSTFTLRQRVEYLECADKLAPFNATLWDAVEFYLPHLEATNRSCPAQQLVDEIISAKTADGASARYIKDLKNRLHHFAIAFDGKPVAKITTNEIDQWLRNLTNKKGKPVAATTRNNFRRLLIVAFNFALNRGYCTANPVVKSAKAKVIETPVGILTVDEITRLLASAPVELVPYVAIGAFAGLRRAELERLDWKEVDLQSRLIEITASKAKSARRRFVKIKPNLLLWLKPYAKSNGFVTPSNFRELLDKARNAAGLETWPNNALRHGFASYYLAHFKKAGVAELALEMGHTSAHLVFHHYRELVKPSEAKRYWNIVAGAAKVFEVSRDGDIRIVAEGLTAVLGVAFDSQDRMYVLEMSTSNGGPHPGDGKVVRVDPHGHQTVIASGLTFPTAMTFGPDGALFVSHKGFGFPPGQGEILLITVPQH